MNYLKRVLLPAILLLMISGLVSATKATVPVTPASDRRSEDQTFLTYPEWFLVYSPDEYADYLKDGRKPSELPFLGHIRQFWQAYSAIYGFTRDRYSFNSEYHTMIGVIGVSTTLEYSLKSAYETLIGRLTEITRGDIETDEDRLATEVASDYVDFIALRPWYEYDFAHRLRQVWSDTSWFGPNMLRKWERKYWLTSEYAGKSIYGWILGKAAQSSFEQPIPETVTVIDHIPGDTYRLPSNIRLIRRENDGSALVAMPRYAPFTQASYRLAQSGIGFIEIAGNRDAILITTIVPKEWQAPNNWAYQVLFVQPIITRDQQQRVAVITSVQQLNKALIEFGQAPYQIEHVYDY